MNKVKNNYFLSEGGEMGALIRSLDWANTCIGPVENWPQSLRTSVSLCLNSRFPIFIWWGKELAMIYNDAYRFILGDKHPRALGCPGRKVWPEIWDIIGPMLESVLYRGEATWSEDQLLLLDRFGYMEECYFTFSYSPIHDESGIGGVFSACTETSSKVIGARRLKTLSDLGKTSLQARTADDVYAKAIHAFEENDKDFPFALIYQVSEDGTKAELKASTPARMGFPASIDLTGDDLVAEPFRQALQGHTTVPASNSLGQYGELPTGAWNQPCRRLLVQPLAQGAQKRPAALLVTGINPHIYFDTASKSFYRLVCDQVATDLNNVLAYEEEKKRAESLLALDKAKTVFFSNVSHEFRTPLTLMLGPLDELLNHPEGNLANDQRKKLELAHSNSERLLRLVNNLLDFSRIEAGRLQPQFEPIDLPSLTAGIAGTFQSVIESAGMQLQVDCPPLSRPVCLDTEMWEKIVLNLLSNAFKYTLEGAIRVELREHGQAVRLSVSDTGVGIAPEELPRIFDRFHRVENSRGRTFEGTGIGLALVQELVKLHGGTLTAESEQGRGSTFTVTLPFGVSNGQLSQKFAAPAAAAPFVTEAQKMIAPGPAEGSKEWSRTGPAGEEKPLVLLADDNPDMCGFVKNLLEGDFRVETAPDGQAALESIRRHKPDLVLSDIMMPRLDGFGLLQAIKDNPATGNLPVILLSARAGEEATAHALGAGADDYLIKPFSSRELVSRIHTHLKIARSKSRNEKELYQLFMQAPVAILILRGPDLTVELANQH
ncbi:ATP-binding protein [Paraflavisolibacter sp. H34]|uniref:ATP-binding protein n=1 Tax=Huijunlia imazamoxiresistens TaxID=3127457 RepID=UPI0030192CA7